MPIVIVLSIAIIVVILAVVFFGPSLLQTTGGRKISIEDVSLSWRYDPFLKGYSLQRVTVTFKNVGGTEIAGYDLYITGQFDGKIEASYKEKGYPTKFFVSGGIERLNPGETRTVSSGGIIIFSPGTYTLTVQAIKGYPTATEVLGERTMTINVP
jgi:hypothetical protein